MLLRVFTKQTIEQQSSTAWVFAHLNSSVDPRRRRPAVGRAGRGPCRWQRPDHEQEQEHHQNAKRRDARMAAVGDPVGNLASWPVIRC